MSVSFLLLALTLICALIAGGLIWRSLRRRISTSPGQTFQGAATRKLSIEELRAIEQYLERSYRSQDLITPSGASFPALRLTLNARSQTVISLKRAITRYGFSTDKTNKWRFYLDATEVHLPPYWEQYITNDNDVELICTDTLPLVISLNGHTLQHYGQQALPDSSERYSRQQASIHGEESEQVELLGTRKETPEEHALNNPKQLREATLICIAFFILFLSLLSPTLYRQNHQ